MRPPVGVSVSRKGTKGQGSPQGLPLVFVALPLHPPATRLSFHEPQCTCRKGDGRFLISIVPAYCFRQIFTIILYDKETDGPRME